jgi:hypothetical protein
VGTAATRLAKHVTIVLARGGGRGYNTVRYTDMENTGFKAYTLLNLLSRDVGPQCNAQE